MAVEFCRCFDFVWSHCDFGLKTEEGQNAAVIQGPSNARKQIAVMFCRSSGGKDDLSDCVQDVRDDKTQPDPNHEMRPIYLNSIDFQ